MIKRAKTEDARNLANLAIQMWTEHNPEDLEEEFRKQGYAAELLSECGKWAKEKGCTDLWALRKSIGLYASGKICRFVAL